MPVRLIKDFPAKQMSFWCREKPVSAQIVEYRNQASLTSITRLSDDPAAISEFLEIPISIPTGLLACINRGG